MAETDQAVVAVTTVKITARTTDAFAACRAIVQGEMRRDTRQCHGRTPYGPYDYHEYTEAPHVNGGTIGFRIEWLDMGSYKMFKDWGRSASHLRRYEQIGVYVDDITITHKVI